MFGAIRNSTFVFLCAAALVVTGCASAEQKSKKDKKKDEPYAPNAKEVREKSAGQPPPGLPMAPYGPPARLVELETKHFDESSGLAASRVRPGVFWTNNDSGKRSLIYAFDREGRACGIFRVTGAEQDDWEDMAAGPGPQQGRSYLYVGDIGDNEHRRPFLTVYRFPEPEPLPAGTEMSKEDARPTEQADAIRFKYPDAPPRDAESLMVHPQTGDIYILTKSLDGASTVYKLRAPYSTTEVNQLEMVAQITVPGLFGGFLTGGDISPDGRRIAVCDYLSAYELTLPAGSSAFDEIWKQPLHEVELGERRQGETVCYGPDGSAIYATSEKPPVPLIEVRRKG
jgi:hypothetical protein